MAGLGRAFCCAAVIALIAGSGAAQAAGAFALGNCGAYGFSYDYPREGARAARTAALEKCSGDCKVIPVRRACAAFAVDGANACGAHGYATASKLGAAQNTALRQCYGYGGRECVIRAWICDAKG
jgi:hypothetical protein